MSKWNKNRFTDHMMENCSREVAKVGNAIIDFSEKHADELSWGRGNDHGTLTFRCNSDFGVLPLFHMTSEGKLESNFLREYDVVMNDVDTFEPISELFFTSSQVDKFLNTMEGCCYRLRQ